MSERHRFHPVMEVAAGARSGILVAIGWGVQPAYQSTDLNELGRHEGR
jgi:hypothetical protein